jgi:hypothetical protein
MTKKVGFIIEDENYISARWPGDAHRFAEAICLKLPMTSDHYRL